MKLSKAIFILVVAHVGIRLGLAFGNKNVGRHNGTSPGFMCDVLTNNSIVGQALDARGYHFLYSTATDNYPATTPGMSSTTSTAEGVATQLSSTNQLSKTTATAPRPRSTGQDTVWAISHAGDCTGTLAVSSTSITTSTAEGAATQLSSTNEISETTATTSKSPSTGQDTVWVTSYAGDCTETPVLSSANTTANGVSTTHSQSFNISTVDGAFLGSSISELSSISLTVSTSGGDIIVLASVFAPTQPDVTITELSTAFETSIIVASTAVTTAVVVTITSFLNEPSTSSLSILETQASTTLSTTAVSSAKQATATSINSIPTAESEGQGSSASGFDVTLTVSLQGSAPSGSPTTDALSVAATQSEPFSAAQTSTSQTIASNEPQSVFGIPLQPTTATEALSFPSASSWTEPTSTPSPTIVQSSNQYSYIGCFTEGVGQRALQGAFYPGDANTISNCTAECYPYRYAGAEYGRECWCGDSFNGGSSLVSGSECWMPCAGDSGVYCGGPVRLSVYERNSTTTEGQTSSSQPVVSTLETSSSQSPTNTPVESNSTIESPSATSPTLASSGSPAPESLSQVPSTTKTGSTESNFITSPSVTQDSMTTTSTMTASTTDVGPTQSYFITSQSRTQDSMRSTSTVTGVFNLSRFWSYSWTSTTWTTPDGQSTSSAGSSSTETNVTVVPITNGPITSNRTMPGRATRTSATSTTTYLQANDASMSGGFKVAFLLGFAALAVLV